MNTAILIVYLESILIYFSKRHPKEGMYWPLVWLFIRNLISTRKTARLDETPIALLTLLNNGRGKYIFPGFTLFRTIEQIEGLSTISMEQVYCSYSRSMDEKILIVPFASQRLRLLIQEVSSHRSIHQNTLIIA